MPLVLRITDFSQRNLGANRIYLWQRGMLSECVATGQDALNLLRHGYEYDLALIDSRLSNMSAMEVVRQMRMKRPTMPVLILTEVAAPEVIVEALGRVDDVVCVPCQAEELIARMCVLICRSNGHGCPVLRSGPVEFDLMQHEVRVHGEPLQLTRWEFTGLELLFLKLGEIIKKETFLDRLCCGLYCRKESPSEEGLRVMMYQLRSKLEKAGVPTLIDTVWGCGYTLRDLSVAQDGAGSNPGNDLPELGGHSPEMLDEEALRNMGIHKEVEVGSVES